MASVSSSSSSTYSGYSSTNRLTGFSGLDTESIIQQLMDAESIPLVSLKQKRQLVAWKQTSYQSVISSLNTIKSKYFDITNKSTCLLSTTTLNGRSATSTNSDYVSVSASSSASVGSKAVTVNQVATAATATSTNISSAISGTVNVSGTSIDLSDQTLKLTLDGVTRSIVLDTYDEATFETDLQTAIDTAFGKTVDSNDNSVSKIVVEYSSGEVSLTTANGSTKLSVDADVSGLGLTSGQSNRISLSSTLETLNDSLPEDNQLDLSSGEISFTINGKLITVNSTDTISSLISTVNNTTDANVVMKYDQLSNTLVLTAKQLGSGSNLEMDDTGLTGNFFGALGFDTGYVEGKDAIITVDGTTITRNSNTITVDGVTYTVKKAHESDNSETITVSQDVDSAVNAITSFVESYNSLITELNALISEKTDSDYSPLTDAQKEEMTETEIENWEAKAKLGLLKNDSIISNMLVKMRRALYESVEGADLTLSDLGIASQSYLDNGKLYIDEDTLRTKLSEDPDAVAKLLNGVSTENSMYSRTATVDQKNERYQSSGVFTRLSDIINDNISTYRDSSGYKGLLLEKAGLEGDTTYYNNVIQNQLDDFDERIDALTEKLEDKEEYYFKKFSTLETLLSQMNSQSSMISSWFTS